MNNPKLNISIGILVFFLLPAISLSASGININGFVYSAVHKESLAGVHVYTEGASAGTTTNNYGYYSITLSETPVVLIFSHIGFKHQQVLVTSETELPLNIWLEENVLDEVEVRGLSRVNEVPLMSMIQLPVSQIKSTPSLMGEKDLFKVLQLMPGVQGGNEGASGIFVRGGGSDQNLIILDDAVVYNISHLFGVFSLFNGDAIKNVQFYKGGFPARYGGRISSVLDIGMKDGSMEKYSGQVGAGIISSAFTLDGPIKKGKGSFLVSGRRTYHNLWTDHVYMENDKQSVYFYDFNLKANWVFDKSNRLYVSGYFGKDNLYVNDYDQFVRNRSGVSWNNSLFTVRWNRLVSGNFFTNASLIYSRYNSGIFSLERYLEIPGQFRMNYSSAIRDVSARYDVQFHAGLSHTIRAGAVLTWHHFIPAEVKIDDSFSGEDTNINFSLNAMEGGLYIEDEINYGSWMLNTGIRLSQYYSEGKNYLRPEPRVNVAYKLSGITSVKASYARMNQYLHLSSSTGVGMPTNFWLPSTDKLLPQSAWQLAAGVASSLTNSTEISLEAFYKEADNVITYSDHASSLLFNLTNMNQSFTDWEKNMYQGQGKSKGLELLIHRKTGRLNGWVGYTLSDAQNRFAEVNEGQWFKSSNHRMHDVSVVLAFDINKRISLGTTWVYTSGRLVTLPTSSSYTYISNNYQQYNLVDYYTERNNWKSKDYHRLDVSIQFKKQKKYGLRTWEIGVYNAYNRMNAFSYSVKRDWETGQRKLRQRTIFPIFPSVTYLFKF